MFLRPLFPLMLLLLSIHSYAQDTLYMRNGRIVACEISGSDTAFLYLKKFDDRQADLTLAKKLVKKIVYTNGSVEKLRLPKTNAGPESVILSIVMPSLNFWGLGAGITCEVPLIENKLTFFLPFYYTWFALGNASAPHVRQIAPAIKYYPGDKLGKSKQRYAIGLQFMKDSGYYRQAYTSSGGHSSRIKEEAYATAILINNSMNFFPGQLLYIGIDLATGTSLDDNTKPLVIQLNASVGYRF